MAGMKKHWHWFAGGGAILDDEISSAPRWVARVVLPAGNHHAMAISWYRSVIEVGYVIATAVDADWNWTVRQEESLCLRAAGGRHSNRA